MKREMIKMKNALCFSLVVGFVAMLASCVKDNHRYINPPATASLVVINASPDAPNMDFFLDNSQVNNAPIIYGDVLGYFHAYSGTRHAIFYDRGTQNTLASDSINLKTNNSYSLFLSNVIAKPDFVLIKDTLVKPASNMAAIRFVNLSADAPAVDLVIKNGAALFTGQAYKSYSSFTGVAAKVNDTLEVVQSGTGTVLASMPNVKFNNSVAYTFWLQGIVNTSVAAQKVMLKGMINGGF